MQTLSNYNFILKICTDYNISHIKTIKTYLNKYPFINNKRKIKATCNSIIVDKKGNEYPYMLPNMVRNDDRLLDFDYIYHTEYKNIVDITKELNMTFKSEKCDISEGNGWHSKGTRYFYKEFTTEY